MVDRVGFSDSDLDYISRKMSLDFDTVCKAQQIISDYEKVKSLIFESQAILEKFNKALDIYQVLEKKFPLYSEGELSVKRFSQHKEYVERIKVEQAAAEAAVTEGKVGATGPSIGKDSVNITKSKSILTWIDVQGSHFGKGKEGRQALASFLRQEFPAISKGTLNNVLNDYDYKS